MASGNPNEGFVIEAFEKLSIKGNNLVLGGSFLAALPLVLFSSSFVFISTLLN